MSFRVLVSRIADAEALEAFRWYADRSETAARQWRAGLTRAIHGLSEHPERPPVSEDDSEALGCEVRLLDLRSPTRALPDSLRDPGRYRLDSPHPARRDGASGTIGMKGIS